MSSQDRNKVHDASASVASDGPRSAGDATPHDNDAPSGGEAATSVEAPPSASELELVTGSPHLEGIAKLALAAVSHDCEQGTEAKPVIVDEDSAPPPTGGALEAILDSADNADEWSKFKPEQELKNDEDDEPPLSGGALEAVLGSTDGTEEWTKFKPELVNEADEPPIPPALVVADAREGISEKIAASGVTQVQTVETLIGSIGDTDELMPSIPFGSAHPGDENMQNEDIIKPDEESLLIPSNEELEDEVVYKTHNGSSGQEGDASRRHNADGRVPTRQIEATQPTPRMLSNAPRNADSVVAAIRIPQRHLSAQTIETRESIPRIPEAFLVEEDDNDVVFAGHAEILLPWWQQSRTKILLAFVCFMAVGFVIAIGVLISLNQTVLIVTNPPSVNPTTAPTLSSAPSETPSIAPTNSALPTFTPSTSPSTGPPTIGPTASDAPSLSMSPTSAPTGPFIMMACRQDLEIESSETLDEAQVGIYEFLMESYTKEFGYKVGKPRIITTSKVTRQSLVAGRRRMQLKKLGGDGRSTGGRQLRVAENTTIWEGRGEQPTSNVTASFEERHLQPFFAPGTPKLMLVVDFTMHYESGSSVYGYDLEDYPGQFQTYINSNLENVTEDMQTRFLPVVQARRVFVVITGEPTPSPSIVATISN